MPDTTLFALFPAVPVTVGGERLHLRPVVLGELPAVERVLQGWQTLVATGGDFANAEAWADFVDLSAAAVGRSRAWIDQLSETDFEALICLVLAVNEEVWKPPKLKVGEDSYSWAKIVQRLSEHGHNFDAIQGFTIGQVRVLLGECFSLESEVLARRIQAAAFAMATPESVGKAVKGLLRG